VLALKSFSDSVEILRASVSENDLCEAHVIVEGDEVIRRFRHGKS
jgi:hypothetical protein